jgi:hypothetical protein
LYETLVTVWIFCHGNELKFTYEHLQFQKIFRLANARREGEGKEGKGRREEGRLGQGKGERGRGGRGVSPKHKSLTPPMITT